MLRPPEPALAAPRPPAAYGVTTAGTFPRVLTALGLLGLAVVTFANSSASRIHTWPLSAVAAALWLFPIGLLLIAMFRRPTWCLPPPLLSIGLALLATATFASALLSPFAAASLPRVWPTFAGIALYLYLHDAWSSPRPLPAARFTFPARVLGLAGVAFVLVSLIQWSGGKWPLPWAGRNAAPFGHSTYTAGAVILLLPWLVLQAAGTRRFVRAAWLGAVVAAVAVLISTSSRGGVLALAGVAVVATALALAFGPWSAQRKWIIALALLALGTVVIVTNPRLRELVLNRRWSEAAKESNTQRQAMLAAGLRLGAERPLLGWGPGTIPLAYPHVRAQLDGGTENILQLHNTPAQVWATTGTLGTIALLMLVAGTAGAVIRAPHTPVVFAASASLLGYSIVALTDHQLDLPAINALVATSLAVITASRALHALPATSLPAFTVPSVASGRVAASSRLITPLVRMLVGLPVALAVAVSLRPTLRELHAHHLYDSALSALGNGQTQAFIAKLDHATAVTPHDPFFQHHAAAWLLGQRANTADPALRLSLARDVASRLESSLATGAHQEFAHFNLAWLYLELDRADDAARHFTATARLVPDKGGVYFGLGLAHQAAGRREAALRCFALEWINDPRSFTSPAWEVPALAAIQPAVREEVLRLYAAVRPQYPAANVVEQWTRWWWGGSISTDALKPGFNAASARFLSAIVSISRRETIPIADAPWAQAYTAWRTARAEGVAGNPDAFAAMAHGDPLFAAALARRARQHADDFRQFLTAPTGEEPELVRTLRRQRPGYGILASHPEGPALSDLYIVQENRVVADLAAGLFPSKGWLPGRFLLALLPEGSR